jgi:hypothetical protein
MSWNTHPTVVVGQTWSASDENTYVKGNLDTLFPYTAAQQVAYSTSSTTLSKATTSAALQVLRSNVTNTAIEFGSLIYNYQNASTAGSTNTTLTNHIMQCGTYSYGATSTSMVYVTVTFPKVFSTSPLVFVQVSTYTAVVAVSISTTSFQFLTVSTSTYAYQWLAAGAA